MTKYHVSPKTGNAGLCKAKVTCPFGGEEDHFATQEAAAKSFEKKQEGFMAFVASSVIGQSRGAYTLATFERDEEKLANPFRATDGQRKLNKAMDDAALGTRMVVENGMVWEKTQGFSGDAWKFVSGKYDQKYRLEPNKTYHGGHLGQIVSEHGGRLEAGGRRQEVISNGYHFSDAGKQELALAVNARIHGVIGANSQIRSDDDAMYFVVTDDLTQGEIKKILKSTPSILQYAPAGETVAEGGVPAHSLDKRSRFVIWPEDVAAAKIS